MICPHCNTPNPPEAVYCINCNALLPSPGEEKRQKRSAVAHALLTALFVPVFYYLTMSIVSFFWVMRFLSTVPSGITQNAYETMFSDALNRDSAYINIISVCICVLITAAFYALRKRSLAEAANIRPAHPVKIGSALICGLTLQIPVGIVLSLIPFSESVVENHNELMNACTSPMWVQLLYGVILAPIIEELFFRGIVHDRLSKAMPVPLAAAISGAVFGVIHGEFLAIIVAFACGFVLALLYSRFNTITVPIAFHMGFNLLSYIVTYITDPLLLIAAAIASVALFIGSTYLLLRKEEADD